MKKYILKNKKPVLELDILKFEEFLNSKDKIVKQNDLKKELFVSTVFLGYDQNHLGRGSPILFETIVFYKNDNEWQPYQDRYCTWEEAEQGHEKAISFLKKKYSIIYETLIF